MTFGLVYSPWHSVLHDAVVAADTARAVARLVVEQRRGVVVTVRADSVRVTGSLSHVAHATTLHAAFTTAVKIVDEVDLAEGALEGERLELVER